MKTLLHIKLKKKFTGVSLPQTYDWIRKLEKKIISILTYFAVNHFILTKHSEIFKLKISVYITECHDLK